MGRNKIRKLLKEYRKQPKWYYHVTFDAIETGQLFNNDEEYAEAEICSIAEAEVQQEESRKCCTATSVKPEAQQKPKKESLFTAFFRTIFGQNDGE